MLPESLLHLKKSTLQRKKSVHLFSFIPKMLTRASSSSSSIPQDENSGTSSTGFPFSPAAADVFPFCSAQQHFSDKAFLIKTSLLY